MGDEPPSPADGIDTERRPFVLIWEVTQACDLACKHCRAEATPTYHPAELSTREGKALLEEISTFGDNQLLVLSGGDPLFRDDTLELIEYGMESGLQMTLTPSGTRSLRPAVIESLEGMGLRRLALSIDGATPAAHDGFRQEPGCFSQTFEAARKAREVGLPLQINTTVCAETVEQLPAIAELVDALDAVLWSVFFLVPIGRGATLDSISPTRADEVMEWLLAVSSARDLPIKTTEAPQYRRVAIQQTRAAASVTADFADSIGRQKGITAGDGFAFISHTGEMYPSGFLPVSAGNVRETSVVDLYRDAPLFRRLRDREHLKGKCGVCEFRHVCGGSRSRAYASTGDPFESDPLCPYRPREYDGPMPTETIG